MGLNDRASAERVHIGFFGLRNAGKSSVVNAVTGQKLSLVSDILGTTTDPVQKAMEILPLGPVVIIDTPGIDDVGALGEMRVKRALAVLSKTDVAVLVVDAQKGLQAADRELTELFKSKNISFVTVYNKSDLLETVPENSENTVYVSAQNSSGIIELKEMIGHLAKSAENHQTLIGDLVAGGDVVLLVTPIDESAPKGRMILPQQQMIREVLDCGAINIVVKETELKQALDLLPQNPKLVITDSQAFGFVSKIVPPDVPLTSFSILFARYKGELDTAAEGAARLKHLKDSDTVLISEGCTHHRQCNDIGAVKLPNWIRKYSGADPKFEYSSGTEFPEDLSKYALVVHCGACMISEREMKSRIARCTENNIPITNYGIAIAEMHGILRRSLAPFPDILKKL